MRRGHTAARVIGVYADVENGSYVSGTTLCLNNTGKIGTNSCNGDVTCLGNSGEERNSACNRFAACKGNSAQASKHSLHYEFNSISPRSSPSRPAFPFAWTTTVATGKVKHPPP